MHGLRGLQSLKGYLDITDNPALTKLDAFEPFTSLGGGLTIARNAALPACRADNLAAALKAHGYQGTITIQDNGGTGACE